MLLKYNNPLNTKESIEKNTDKENPTDYVQLLPSDLLVVNLSDEEKNYILDELIYFLSKVSKFSLKIFFSILA